MEAATRLAHLSKPYRRLHRLSASRAEEHQGAVLILSLLHAPHTISLTPEPISRGPAIHSRYFQISPCNFTHASRACGSLIRPALLSPRFCTMFGPSLRVACRFSLIAIRLFAAASYALQGVSAPTHADCRASAAHSPQEPPATSRARPTWSDVKVVVHARLALRHQLQMPAHAAFILLSVGEVVRLSMPCTHTYART